MNPLRCQKDFTVESISWLNIVFHLLSWVLLFKSSIMSLTNFDFASYCDKESKKKKNLIKHEKAFFCHLYNLECNYDRIQSPAETFGGFRWWWLPGNASENCIWGKSCLACKLNIGIFRCFFVHYSQRAFITPTFKRGLL